MENGLTQFNKHFNLIRLLSRFLHSQKRAPMYGSQVKWLLYGLMENES
jgi:hypothetical protein